MLEYKCTTSTVRSQHRGRNATYLELEHITGFIFNFKLMASFERFPPLSRSKYVKAIVLLQLEIVLLLYNFATASRG